MLDVGWSKALIKESGRLAHMGSFQEWARRPHALKKSRPVEADQSYHGCRCAAADLLGLSHPRQARMTVFRKDGGKSFGKAAPDDFAYHWQCPFESFSKFPYVRDAHIGKSGFHFLGRDVVCPSGA